MLASRALLMVEVEPLREPLPPHSNNGSRTVMDTRLRHDPTPLVEMPSANLRNGTSTSSLLAMLLPISRIPMLLPVRPIALTPRRPDSVVCRCLRRHLHRVMASPRRRRPTSACATWMTMRSTTRDRRAGITMTELAAMPIRRLAG